MNRTINAKYWLGDIVFLRVNEDQKPGMITRVNLTAAGSISFCVGWRGGNETWHFECELTSEFVPDYGTADALRESK